MNKIKLIPKSKFSYKILVDDKEIGVLGQKDILNIISDFDTHNITDEQKEDLLKKIKEKSLSKFLNYLAYRERSELQARIYLQKLYLDEEVIDDFLDFARKNNYLNQQRFAYDYARSLFDKNKSRKYIFFKLKEKGISESLADKILSEFDFADDDRMDLIIKKLLNRYKDINNKRKKYEKTLSYLVRNGFEYESVKDKVWNLIEKEK